MVNKGFINNEFKTISAITELFSPDCSGSLVGLGTMRQSLLATNVKQD